MPKLPSLILKNDLPYSWSWHMEKINPKIIVKKRKKLNNLFLFMFKKECERVTEIPDLRRIKVFKNGTLIASNDITPLGGQLNPFSKPGLKKKWKYDQKNEKKKKTSEEINKIIAILIPISKLKELNPWRENSFL